MRRAHGFTLIEAMIVVAIIAILSAIAIPLYTEYVVRSRLTGGVSGLAAMRVRMEQYFQDNRSYTPGGVNPPACTNNSVAPLPTDNNFVFTCALGAATYTITATGANTLNGMVYTVNEQNVRTTTGVLPGWAGAGANCWVLKKDGSC